MDASVPTTLAAVLVTVFAIIPGAIGTYIYAAINGLHWRQAPATTAIRYLSFSVLGLFAYVLVAEWRGWPPAAHVIPATFSDDTFTAATLSGLVAPYLGHLVGAAVMGALAVVGVRVLSRFTRATVRPASWDSFISESVPKHWVVVTLTSSDVFVGQIEVADVNVAPEERDLVLTAVGTLDDAGAYVPTAFHAMFLPAELVQNIATLRRPSDDESARTAPSDAEEGGGPGV